VWGDIGHGHFSYRPTFLIDNKIINKKIKALFFKLNTFTHPFDINPETEGGPFLQAFSKINSYCGLPVNTVKNQITRTKVNRPEGISKIKSVREEITMERKSFELRRLF